jgi:hypothetical protein
VVGGNGFYWVTTAPGDDPFVIEVRRGMAGTRVWESPPGEWHQAMTGEHGGLWRHGTPGDAVVVASARRFSGAYQGAVEDVTTADSQQGGDVSDLVRSDVVFFATGAGGAVFSVGSIAWCGALRDGDSETPVGQMTWNVLSRFREEAPFGN